MNIIRGSWMSHAVCVTIQLGIPDLLAKGPCTAEELSSTTGVVGTAASTSSLGRTIQLGCPRDVALRFCIVRKSHRQDIEFGRVMTGHIRMHNETAGEITIQSQIERDNGRCR